MKPFSCQGKGKNVMVANSRRPSIGQAFREIKRLYFPKWDRQDIWRVSTRSARRVHGRCDPERRVIEIVVQHADPDERDRLLVHEICHAVASVNHGKKWQERMEMAARRAEEFGRQRLSQLLREELAAYQQASGSVVNEAYDRIRDAIWEYPDLTFAHIKRWLADEYGLLASEVCTTFRRARSVFDEARQ